MRLSGSILATVLLVLAGAGVAGAPRSMVETQAPAAGVYAAADLSHPRLLLRAGEEVPVREAVARQPEFAALQQRVFDYSAAILDEPVLERVKIGKRLLAWLTAPSGRWNRCANL